MSSEKNLNITHNKSSAFWLVHSVSHRFFPMIFFETPPIKADAPHGASPSFKDEAPSLESKAPFQEMIPGEKKREKI